MSTISISNGNIKMGNIPSVSLPSGITCRQCLCQKKCYARRMERLRPSVASAYRKNLDVLQNNPETYWREVEAAVMLTRFFRFHVSGDIIDAEYFSHMVEIALRNRHCEILCFTKNYEVVNCWVSQNGLTSLPENLHIVFSAWVGLEMSNPFLLPEAHVRYKDGTTTNVDLDRAVECGGNCTTCATTDGGCWTLQRGTLRGEEVVSPCGQVIFNEH